MTGASVVGHDGEMMAEINITPFTDVLLVLLIIFMILASIAVPPGFQKELRGHLNPGPKFIDPRPSIEVLVARSGAIYIDGVATSADDLYAAIAAAVDAHKKPNLSTHIVIIADADAKYDTIVRILDAGRQAGDDDVGFVTRQ